MARPQILLASRSPRRRELLKQIGVGYTTHPVSIDESPRATEEPDRYVHRLAEEKARLAWSQARPEIPVLGADTTVVIAGRIYGKPKDEEDAVAMLLSLSATTHQVLSAVAVTDGDRVLCRVQTSDVTFGPISEPQARAYWHTGEPADKAGGYAIQGLGAIFVDHLAGSFSGVMGLPLRETAELLELFDLPLLNEKNSRNCA